MTRTYILTIHLNMLVAMIYRQNWFNTDLWSALLAPTIHRIHEGIAPPSARFKQRYLLSHTLPGGQSLHLQTR